MVTGEDAQENVRAGLLAANEMELCRVNCRPSYRR